ncbi:MAG: sigma-70 family RNA polymerase sigma factor [Ignavibacteriaceae bacterium]|nr:sigma-70 family RNA polymerase sigma factor [Ignavibacteriaceae bacterium]
MKKPTDTEIIESILKGNQSDFSILVDRYKNKAFSLLRKMLKNEFDAEEVLQDCFLKAFNNLNSFRKDSKFSTWFYKIVYNSALTKLSNKRWKTESEMISADEELQIHSDFSYDYTEKADLAEFLSKQIEKLPANYASVIAMFYLDSLSCEEISEVTGNSVNNVKVILHRSRNALRDLIIKNNLMKEIL